MYLIQQKCLQISFSKISMVKLNLFDFMDMDDYYGWRYRITDLVVCFMDVQNKLIPNGLRKKFSMDIDFPSTFYDLDWNKDPHMFATSFQMNCVSQYSTSGNIQKSCGIADDIWSTSPNGTFVFRLDNEEQYLNLTQLHYLKININATMINFP